MKKFRILQLTLLAPLVCASAAYASSLQDWEINVNGTDYFPSGGSTFASVPGLNSAGYNATTGQGTLTLTFNPGTAGNYFVGAYFYVPVSVPFYNEYGAVNGSAAAGQSWQIDNPEYSETSLNHGAGSIVDNLANETLSNTNLVPGSLDNYLNNCGANGGGAVNTACNDFVSLALGFNFSLTATQYEVLTVTLSPNNPGGFSLEAIQPVDGANAAQSQIYYSGTAQLFNNNQPPPPPPPSGVPEPASVGMLSLGGGALALILKRRVSRS
jgi:hypothetical protein